MEWCVWCVEEDGGGTEGMGGEGTWSAEGVGWWRRQKRNTDIGMKGRQERPNGIQQGDSLGEQDLYHLDVCPGVVNRSGVG